MYIPLYRAFTVPLLLCSDLDLENDIKRHFSHEAWGHRPWLYTEGSKVKNLFLDTLRLPRPSM